MIYRLNLPVTDYQEIPNSVISVAACRSGRSDVIDLWYETGGRDTKQGLYILGTGHPTPWAFGWVRDCYRFIDTVVTPSGLVWHVYTGPLKGEHDAR